MRRSIYYLFLLVTGCILLSMNPARSKKVIFFGDSITALAVKEGGYIHMLQDTLKASGKGGVFELSGAGISGHKVYDLYFRMDSDVLLRKPDIVVIYIGVNDVWHKTSSGTGTDANRFESFYSAMVRKMQAAKIKLILCTPAVIGERRNNTNQQDGDLNAYSDIIRKLARQYHCGLADFREIFTAYINEHNTDNKESGILTRDRVHLNEAGNRLVARTLYPLLQAAL